MNKLLLKYLLIFEIEVISQARNYKIPTNTLKLAVAWGVNNFLKQ